MRDVIAGRGREEGHLGVRDFSEAVPMRQPGSPLTLLRTLRPSAILTILPRAESSTHPPMVSCQEEVREEEKNIKDVKERPRLHLPLLPYVSSPATLPYLAKTLGSNPPTVTGFFLKYLPCPPMFSLIPHYLPLGRESEARRELASLRHSLDTASPLVVHGLRTGAISEYQGRRFFRYGVFA